MLRALDIKDMLIIDRLELEFQPGLNVLTGETGAGKSILLDALGFVLGWRGRAELVRTGADQGEVTAVFDIADDHPGRAILQKAGFGNDDDLILRRVNSKDGRKTAWINDRRASGEILRALSDTLVELHGQHDDRGLLNPRMHRALLDSFAGLGDLVDSTRNAWRAVNAARKALSTLEAAQSAAQEEEDFLRHALAELDALSPVEGEEAALDTKRRLMQSAARIKEDVAKAANALGLQGAEGLVTDANRWLADAIDHAEGRLDNAMSAIERVLTELDAAQTGVAECLDALSFNPAELEDTEERLFAIRGVARKHDVQPDELADFTETLRIRLNAVDGAEEHLREARTAVLDAQKAYDTLTGQLSSKRTTAAAALDKAMAKELAPLKMERAVFFTKVEAGEASAEGVDDVTFTVATNPGAPAGPLNKIASGGELSRFLLALKVCLTKAAKGGLTLIFDEIDRGVGGATADAVGRRLANLAEGGQVLVVTHSPQVAALGQHHWRVEKKQTSDQTTSSVLALTEDERVTEIARMLSGDSITDAAREAAKMLMK